MNRYAITNRIREKLRNDIPSIGSWMQIPDSSIAEIMGRAGYDWIAIDMEHGSISLHQLPGLFRALELGGTLPLVRLAEGSAKDCKQALDAGSAGVIVPMVESADQLHAVRDACRWPPAGNRGVGFCRANLFGKDYEPYKKEAQSPLLVPMIEHFKALAQLDAILNVDGVDAIFVGPYDLSASMGLAGQFEHNDFKAAMQFIRDRTVVAGVPVGVHLVEPNKNELLQKISEGYRFLAYSIDAVMLRLSVENPNLG